MKCIDCLRAAFAQYGDDPDAEYWIAAEVAYTVIDGNPYCLRHMHGRLSTPPAG